VFAPHRVGVGRVPRRDARERANTGECEQMNSSSGLDDLNLSELQQYLGRMNFPADKQEVASNAESNDAPQAVVAQIRNSAIERFESPEEVLQEVRGR
jgi:hypothetical protein